MLGISVLENVLEFETYPLLDIQTNWKQWKTLSYLPTKKVFDIGKGNNKDLTQFVSIQIRTIGNGLVVISRKIQHTW